MDNTKCGFCAEYHNMNYRCANCGHTKTESAITNHYEHKIVEWEDQVCTECGFKSLKPVDLALERFAESLKEYEANDDSLEVPAFLRRENLMSTPEDKGDWAVHSNNLDVSVISTDFTHDVWLVVTGDFSDINERIAYAQLIAKRLNDTKGVK